MPLSSIASRAVISREAVCGSAHETQAMSPANALSSSCCAPPLLVNSYQVVSYVRCLDKMFKWPELSSIASAAWPTLLQTNKLYATLLAPMACSSAVHTGAWPQISVYVDQVSALDHPPPHPHARIHAHTHTHTHTHTFRLSRRIRRSCTARSLQYTSVGTATQCSTFTRLGTTCRSSARAEW
jgi:hypothetical protein